MKKIYSYFSLVLLLPFSIGIVFAKDKIEPSPVLGTQIGSRRATEPELRTFLKKLNELKDSYELVEFSPSDFSVYKNICRDSKTKKLEDCGNSYHTLWMADINNDGKSDYVWTDEGEGSDHYDYLEVYDDAEVNRILSTQMPQFKCDYSNIARDLFTVEDGMTYFHLVSFSAQDKNGKTIAGGATSNAAEGAYFSVTTEYKCLWRNGQIKVVNKKESKEKYQ